PFPGPTGTHGPPGASRWHGSPPGPRSALHKAPPYFVELPPQELIYARTALVRSTVTGRVLTTVSPPRPYKIFTFVSGTADDRTFVLAAQRWWHIASETAGQRAQERDVNARVLFFKLTYLLATRNAQPPQLKVPGQHSSRNLGGLGFSPSAPGSAWTSAIPSRSSRWPPVRRAPGPCRARAGSSTSSPTARSSPGPRTE